MLMQELSSSSIEEAIRPKYFNQNVVRVPTSIVARLDTNHKAISNTSAATSMDEEAI